jgi:hypothetical protein
LSAGCAALPARSCEYNSYTRQCDSVWLSSSERRSSLG